MSSCQFFHDCSFAPVNCQKKKKEKKKGRTIALSLTTLFSNSLLCSHFLFSFSLPSCSFPVPRSPFPVPRFSNIPLQARENELWKKRLLRLLYSTRAPDNRKEKKQNDKKKREILDWCIIALTDVLLTTFEFCFFLLLSKLTKAIHLQFIDLLWT